jgi:two-component system, LytTR family, sensor kinase
MINRVLGFLSRKVVYHAIIWLVCLVVFVFGVDSGEPILKKMLNEIINLSFYGFLVYFNVYYLFPSFFSNKKTYAYFALLIAVSFLLTPIKVFILYLWFSNQAIIQQQILDNFFLYFLLFFIVAVGSTIAKILKDYFKNQREKQFLLQQNMETELQFLKSQINPHFLFNTLNNLYSLTLKKSDLAPEIVLKLSDMMRYMLYECNEPNVDITKEINYLKNYIILEKLRFKEIEQIEFKTAISNMPIFIPPLLIIPFFENAFKHGSNIPFIKSKLTMENGNQLYFEIVNKKGNLNQNKNGGIGLANVKRRLELLFPQGFVLNVFQDDIYFSVNMKINI